LKKIALFFILLTRGRDGMKTLIGKAREIVNGVPAETWGSILAGGLILCGFAGFVNGVKNASENSKQKFLSQYDENTFVIVTKNDSETLYWAGKLSDFSEKHNINIDVYKTL
jgi:hypothetical protein